MRRILCLHLPNWPIQRLLAAPNKDEGRTTKGEKNHLVLPPSFVLRTSYFVLLHARDPRRGDLIVACNAAAEQCGVRLQMPLAEAATLAECHGECLILPHDPAADLAALATLAQRCERFSPIVGWKTADEMRNAGAPAVSRVGGVRSVGPDCLFLDVTGIGVLFESEEKLGRAVVADIAQHGFDCRVAIADTIGAAWAMTRRGFKLQVSSFKLDSSDATTWNLELGTWNLESLRLPPETLDLLAQLGIKQLSELLALPRESLRARFGEQLLLRIDQLCGAAQETIVPYRPPPQFIEEQVLEFPVERQEVIEQILRQLVHRIATALANRREGVLKLACRLDCAPGQPIFLEVGLFRPSADQEHLCDLLRMQLEHAALPGPVGRVRVEATLTAPLENRQGELFAAGQHEAARQFALLIDRCSSRLGPSAVLRPQLTADPLPEKAVRYKPGIRRQGSGSRRFQVSSSKFQVHRKQKKNWNLKPETYNSLHSALLRPLFLHSPPQPLDVLSVAPDGPPVSFCFQGQSHQVAAHSGPERIETGWWRGKSIRRDYWRVETTTGQRFWLFRSLDDRAWHLHGAYE